MGGAVIKTHCFKFAVRDYFGVWLMGTNTKE